MATIASLPEGSEMRSRFLCESLGVVMPSPLSGPGFGEQAGELLAQGAAQLAGPFQRAAHLRAPYHRAILGGSHAAQIELVRLHLGEHAGGAAAVRPEGPYRGTLRLRGGPA